VRRVLSPEGLVRNQAGPASNLAARELNSPLAGNLQRLAAVPERMRLVRHQAHSTVGAGLRGQARSRAARVWVRIWDHRRQRRLKLEPALEMDPTLGQELDLARLLLAIRELYPVTRRVRREVLSSPARGQMHRLADPAAAPRRRTRALEISQSHQAAAEPRRGRMAAAQRPVQCYSGLPILTVAGPATRP
jgi:hypothetical protein